MKEWIFITGATGGLGRAFAVECARRGWSLYLTDLHAEALETLACALRRTYSVQVLYHPSDLTDADSRQRLVEAARASQQRFWGLINVAGADFEGLFYERNSQQIYTILRLNIEGTLAMTHALMELRDPYVPFRIVNVASLAAFFPMPLKATYSASKRFLLDFSLALREEVRAAGATVTVLAPAGMPTTPGSIQGIEAQGLMGALTTQNIGAVAAGTIDAALRGQAIYIPGWLNRLLRLGAVLPAPLVARFVGGRWRVARSRRSETDDQACSFCLDTEMAAEGLALTARPHPSGG